jgi:hypothetical protein
MFFDDKRVGKDLDMKIYENEKEFLERVGDLKILKEETHIIGEG